MLGHLKRTNILIISADVHLILDILEIGNLKLVISTKIYCKENSKNRKDSYFESDWGYDNRGKKMIDRNEIYFADFSSKK